MIPAFAKLQQQDRVIQQLQKNVGATLDPLSQNMLLNGKQVPFTASSKITAGTDMTIAHGLGHAPNGILPGLAALALTLYVSPTTNPDSSQLMILRASQDIPSGTVLGFWVY